MDRLATWQPCLIEPEKGYADFDGIIINSDAIVDPRKDRVMPLLEEEQVLMCRLMLGRLRPGHLVLDVGTGSGVFALWAAKKSMCKVIGIDISKRAIRFAAENAKKNGIVLVNQLRDIKNGEIYLHHCSFEDFIHKYRAFSMQFDIVFLNPPFNPTCPIVLPAIHANAGPNGQRPFKSQIRLVPKIQKIGGYCLGYQMSYDANENEIRVLKQIKHAYNNKCKIFYTNVLNDKKSIDAEQFLKSQYINFLDKAEGVNISMNRYINMIAKNGQCFSLIYYEVRKENAIVLKPPTEVIIQGMPNKNWRDRIWLHKCIVENTS